MTQEPPGPVPTYLLAFLACAAFLLVIMTACASVPEPAAGDTGHGWGPTGFIGVDVPALDPEAV